MIVGVISGYFNPVHFGHIQYVLGAKEQCDWLVCIVNNDKQVGIKGSKKFMDEDHRAKIMSCIKGVDEAIISLDEDRTVCQSLRYVYMLYKNNKMKFFNSGDRQGNNIECKEKEVCDELGIDFVILPLPKIYSSSQILSQ